MKPAVLTIDLEFIKSQNIPTDLDTYGVFDFNLNTVPQNAFSFINRLVVDCKEEDNPIHFKIGATLPQILAYIVIKCGDEYLTYSRAKGAETRLHGSSSLGFGGHVDIQDSYALAVKHNRTDITYQDILEEATYRELSEELNFTSDLDFKVNKIIVDMTNSVGQVHVGLPIIVELDSKDEIKADPAEIALPEWKSKDQLVQDLDTYENWSQLVINNLL